MRSPRSPARDAGVGSPRTRALRERMGRGVALVVAALLLFSVTVALSASGWALLVGTAAFALGTAGVFMIVFGSEGGDDLRAYKQ